MSEHLVDSDWTMSGTSQCFKSESVSQDREIFPVLTQAFQHEAFLIFLYPLFHETCITVLWCEHHCLNPKSEWSEVMKTKHHADAEAARQCHKELNLALHCLSHPESLFYHSYASALSEWWNSSHWIPHNLQSLNYYSNPNLDSHKQKSLSNFKQRTRLKYSKHLVCIISDHLEKSPKLLISRNKFTKLNIMNIDYTSVAILSPAKVLEMKANKK